MGYAGGVNSGRNEARGRQKRVSAVVCLSLAPNEHSDDHYNFTNSFLNDVSE